MKHKVHKPKTNRMLVKEKLDGGKSAAHAPSGRVRGAKVGAHSFAHGSDSKSVIKKPRSSNPSAGRATKALGAARHATRGSHISAVGQSGHTFGKTGATIKPGMKKHKVGKLAKDIKGKGYNANGPMQGRQPKAKKHPFRGYYSQ